MRIPRNAVLLSLFILSCAACAESRSSKDDGNAAGTAGAAGDSGTGDTGGNPGDTGGNPGDTGGSPGDTGGNPGGTGGNPGGTGGNPGGTGGNPGGTGGDGEAGTGGVIDNGETIEISCLKELTAVCPTTGACTYEFNDAGQLDITCFASGVSVEEDRTVRGVVTYAVSKPDGSLCYTLDVSGGPGYAFESGSYTWRNAEGQVAATGY